MFNFEHASSQGGREITNACAFVVRHHVSLKEWKSAKFEFGRVVLNRSSLFRVELHFTA